MSTANLFSFPHSFSLYLSRARSAGRRQITTSGELFFFFVAETRKMGGLTSLQPTTIIELSRQRAREFSQGASYTSTKNTGTPYDDAVWSANNNPHRVG